MRTPLALTALACIAPALAAADPVAFRYADAHVHFVDFFQESAGVEALFAALDDARIGHIVLMGIPVTKLWHEDAPKRPRYYQGDESPVYWYSATDAIVGAAVTALDGAARSRVHAFVSGINSNDKNATAHIERMLELYPGVFEGIGEIVTRHDDLTNLLPGEPPRANGEAMMRIYAFAAEHDLPVMLHSNLTSVREREPLYREEIESALASQPGTRIIWAHAGASAEIHRGQGPMPFLLPTLTDLLDRYDNLWIDLSWVVLEPYLLDANGEPRAEWLALIRRHPDRFLLGSDVVGRFETLGEKMTGFEPVLEALPEEIAQRIARENLLGVLPHRARTSARSGAISRTIQQRAVLQPRE